MASITSLTSSSSTSSIYGNRNIISGLASGMDTEAMIENAVSGIKARIQGLQQRRTKIEWQQEAFRSIIDKAVNFSNKYTSYTSKTNLLSSSFFTNAVNTTTLGTYADKVTASGKTSSDIKLNAVKQMATSASYTVSGLGGLASSEFTSVTSGKAFDLTETIPVNNISGSLSIQYGGTNGTTFDIKFDELENLSEMEGRTNAEKLANAINQKLSEVSYTYTKNGFTENVTADKAVKAVAKNGEITFTDALGNGNSIKISSASGRIKSVYGISSNTESFQVGVSPLVRDTPVQTYLADKTLGFTFNGTTKTINMSDVIDRAGFTADDDADAKNAKFITALQSEVDTAFGANKITVSRDSDSGKLSFTPTGQGDVLSMGGSALEGMGFESGDSNYINTAKKLTDILGDKANTVFSWGSRLAGAGGATKKTSPNGTTYYVDKAGNRVDQYGYRVDNDGTALYDLEINGAHISVTKDTTLEGLMNSINANPDAGVKVSYSKLTNEFKFTTTETGANSKIEMGGLAKSLFAPSSGSSSDKFANAYGLDIDDTQIKGVDFDLSGFAVTVKIDSSTTMEGVVEQLNRTLPNMGYNASYNALSGQIVITDDNGNAADFTVNADGEELQPKANSTYTPGHDAIVDVEINGVRFENLTRSSNNIDLDGLTVSVKGTFNEDIEYNEKGEMIDKDGNTIEPVTFETTTDTDTIIDAIRSFVEDYNEMVTELKNAYSTQPLTDSNNNRYDPLTAEAEAEYSESELAAYNEKAKTGILFGDTTLSSFYSRLLNAIQPGGTDGQTLRDIGIGTSYSDGMTTLSLDEDKLRNALETDPDKVKDAFTKSTESGSSSNGLMQTLQNTLNTYVKTTGEPKGVLITKAGSVKAPTSLNSNSLKSQIDSLDSQIERWQDKMSDQIDRYTSQFSRLEQLIAEMNSQASAFAGLMGGDSGY